MDLRPDYEIKAEQDKEMDKLFDRFHAEWRVYDNSLHSLQRLPCQLVVYYNARPDPRCAADTRINIINQVKQLIEQYEASGQPPPLLSPVRLLQYHKLPIISEEVDSAICSWILSPGSKLLWVRSPAGYIWDESTIGAAIRAHNCAWAAGLPAVFISTRHYYYEDPTLPLTNKRRALYGFMFGFFQELARLIPAEFKSHAGLSLGLTWNYWRRSSIYEALEVLHILLGLAPTALVLIVDGLDRVEWWDTVDFVEQLVGKLRCMGSGRRFKVLFTTARDSRNLAGVMDHDERVMAN
ncbi:hypothetical protein F4804DRAFT_348958 [Jackrogersella minutella]|nr:hypothetical protein F4804DRAFT_348958 [Jackrogersella minutella]